jgi:N-acetylglucosamine transport system permease protein
MVQAFWVALHRWRGVSGDMTFVGLEHFFVLAQDERFHAALTHNLFFFVMVASSVLTLGLFFGNALSQPLRGVEFFRALFLFPNVVSIVAVSVLWMFLYNPSFGVNALLKMAGKEEWALTWLADPRTVLPAVALTYVWYVLGFYILLFRAGIQSISADVNEAAMVDGATGSQRFWKLTLPLLSPIVRLAVIYLIINSMNQFALVWVMAPPSGTAGATELSLTYLYQKGFLEFDFGRSSAIGAVNFLIVMTITVVLQRVWRAE